MDEGSDHSSNTGAPALPPKGRFLSTESLNPPILPPKQHSSSRSTSNLNKRVSISTNTVHIINSDTDCLTDGSVAERIKTFMNHNLEKTFKSSSGIKARPRRSSETSQDPTKIDDLPKELPSVRNLAFMFSGQRKSPEPLPRNSLNKVPTWFYYLPWFVVLQVLFTFYQRFF